MLVSLSYRPHVEPQLLAGIGDPDRLGLAAFILGNQVPEAQPDAASISAANTIQRRDGRFSRIFMAGPFVGNQSPRIGRTARR